MTTPFNGNLPSPGLLVDTKSSDASLAKQASRPVVNAAIMGRSETCAGERLVEASTVEDQRVPETIQQTLAPQLESEQEQRINLVLRKTHQAHSMVGAFREL